MEIRSPLTERAAPSFDELAAQQSVQPVVEFDELLGPHDPVDESTEEFSKLLRGWRSDKP